MTIAQENIQPVKQQPPLPSDNRRRNRLIFYLTGGILAIGICWLLLWLVYFQYYESTDDAYVNGNKINITPVISGTPVALFADTNDLVEEGQLLVLLDDTYYRLVYEKELQTLASTLLQVKQLYDTVKTDKISVENKAVGLKNAAYDFENRSRLIESKGISMEDFVHAQNRQTIAELDVKMAQSQLQIAIDATGDSPIRSHPLLEKQKTIVREAFYNLKHCAIYAPAKGYIAQRIVQPGQWVTSHTFLMSLIPIDSLWVDANFKETQLDYMRIGQPAEIYFDIYGSKIKFDGKIQGIGFGTGSVFALIPPQNATGNWIKIVQRLPVKILLDSEQLKKYPLRLGLSANVDVDISEIDLPMVSQVPSTEIIASTYIYKLDMTEVDTAIEKLIAEYLPEEDLPG